MPSKDIEEIKKYLEEVENKTVIEALEKQIPIKPRVEFTGQYYCPSCNKKQGWISIHPHNYCNNCGQAFDMENTND